VNVPSVPGFFAPGFFGVQEWIRRLEASERTAKVAFAEVIQPALSVPFFAGELGRPATNHALRDMPDLGVLVVRDSIVEVPG